MAELLPGEVAEILGEEEEQRGMDDVRLKSIVSSMVNDAENWIQQDVSPSREKAHRYYQGGCDVPYDDNRSSFVMRVVRDCIEQATPKIMEIFVGAEYLVSFRSPDMEEQSQSAAEDATESFHDVFWNQNEGWENLEAFIRNALKAKTGIFKSDWVTETVIREREFDGSLLQFQGVVASDDVEVVEYIDDMEDQMARGMIPDPSQIVVAATLKVKEEVRRLCIDVVPPEDFLINRSATSTAYGKFNLIGQKSVKTVSDCVEMGIPEELAVKHAGNADSTTSGDYPAQERRARRTATRDQNTEHTQGDNSQRPVDVYELYVRVDMDEDGIAELVRVIAVGDGIGAIADAETVEDHPYAVASAIAVEHSVIGESMADNIFDLQDVDTQLTRNILNNMSLVNNPRPIASDGVDLATLLDNRFGMPIKGQPSSVDWHVVPFVGDKGLMIRESFNETRAERTGITKESMGLAAKNLQASSEIGVMAILGAGLTQPEMIAATMAHRAFVPLAKRVIRLLREEGVPLAIESKGTNREVNPSQWPEGMKAKVGVGLATGTRQEKLAALQMVTTKQEQILLQAGPDNPWVTPEHYSRSLHQMAELGKLGNTSAYFNTPEETKQWLQAQAQQAAQTPPEPPAEIVEIREKEQTRRMKDQADAQAKVQSAAINAQVDQDLGEAKLEQERSLGIREQNIERELAERGQDMRVSNDTNIRRQ